MRAKLGILAGGGDLPAHLISACRASGRPFYVIAFKAQADEGLVDGVPHAWVRLGAAGTTVRLLHQAGVEEVILAGAIVRPSLTDLRPDRRAAMAIARAGWSALGDDALLRVFVGELERDGFRVVGVETVIDDLVAPFGPLGAVAPDARARRDIDRGIAAARAIGARDLGQAAVVRDGEVLAVEDAKGTDALLARCRALRREEPGGVLVKVRKPQQDRRVDLPAIGLATVEGAAAAGLCGIAVEAGGALVIDRAAVARAADEAGLFVVGVEVPG